MDVPAQSQVEGDGRNATEFESNPLTAPDWGGLRNLSLLPGGFGERRAEIWAQVLGVSAHQGDAPAHGIKQKGSDNPEVHQDERQIRLDTDRSFVLYPVGDDMRARDILKEQLYDLLVSVFRKRRRLHYFQGYHDIVSVLFLTLPKHLQFLCVEKLSLHRLRDSMGTGLEPVIGLLKVLKRLLGVADPEFASLVEHTSLPYYALSNLLTLFSHDVPTLALIQHVFDYLFCRPPIVVVYLAAAIILTRKEEVRRLTEEDEEGMIHSVLSSLPDLYEESEGPSIPELKEPEPEEEKALPDGTTEPAFEETSSPPLETWSRDLPDQTLVKSGDLSDRPETLLAECRESGAGQTEFQGLVGDVPPPDTPGSRPGSFIHSEVPSSPNGSLTLDLSTAPSTTDEPPTPSDTSPPPYDPESSSKSVSEPPSPAMSSYRFPHRPKVSLTSVFQHADTLFEKYPPTDPTINIYTIMGPQSVMLTWSQHFKDLPSDDEAELMVDKPDLIVLPLPEEPPSDHDDSGAQEKDVGKHRRRKLHKPRRLNGMMVQRKAVVASAVLVLGVAMAVYGTGGFRTDGGSRSHKEWKALSRFVGALFFGAGEKLFDSMWG